MQNSIKADLQRSLRNSTASFLNLINPLVTENTPFVLSCSSEVKVIQRSRVNSGIQNSDHFDIYLYHTTLRKNNTVCSDNLKRKGLWKAVVTNNSEEK